MGPETRTESIHSCSDHEHGCVVIKHTNPCGVAVDTSQSEAWTNALASDSESAFGCVIAFTKEVQPDTATAIGGHFFECMIAPGYHPEAWRSFLQRRIVEC